MSQCSDAPALSTDQESSILLQQQIDNNEVADGATVTKSDWDDEALAVAYTHGISSVSLTSNSNSTTAELGTLQGSSNASSATEDIAEKLRVQETKAQLAAARLGMERQAALLKSQKEAAESAVSASSTSALGGGSKWVSSRQRMEGSSISRGRFGNVSAKLDVADNELFPDLQQAEKILESQKPKKPNAGPAKKALGGATWASKPSAVAPAPTITAEAPPTEATEPAVSVEILLQTNRETSPEVQGATEGTNSIPTEVVANTSVDAVTAVPAPVKKTLAKKKKKDLSTFKTAA